MNPFENKEYAVPLLPSNRITRDLIEATIKGNPDLSAEQVQARLTALGAKFPLDMIATVMTEMGRTP